MPKALIITRNVTVACEPPREAKSKAQDAAIRNANVCAELREYGEYNHWRRCGESHAVAAERATKAKAAFLLTNLEGWKNDTRGNDQTAFC
jgi:hypothetical protein